MKKGIEVHSDYDRTGKWCLVITKKKGRFTLDEITEAAREWEWAWYLMPLNCAGDEELQYDEDDEGDCVTLYRMEDYNK